MQNWLADSTVIDMRTKHKRPPYPAVLVNAQNEKVPGAFYYDFATGQLGRYDVKVQPDGSETVTVECELQPDGTVEKKAMEIWEWRHDLRLVPVAHSRRLGGTMVFKGSA